MALFPFNQKKKEKKKEKDSNRHMVVIERLCMQVNGFSFSGPFSLVATK